MERDSWNERHWGRGNHFNSHAHVERDGMISSSYLLIYAFQLTRSRGAWHCNVATFQILFVISTHTLTWSVTNIVINFRYAFKISTHTLTWSVTHIWRNLQTYKGVFQLTRSRGAWLASSTDLATPATISTHTLTWSVTVIFFIFVEYVQNFNSHAHVERDASQRCIRTTTKNFNSHAHVERDHPYYTTSCNNNNFNSHAHVERDDITTFFTETIPDFNSHAHVERDSSSTSSSSSSSISTHTLTWSVTSLPLAYV